MNPRWVFTIEVRTDTYLTEDDKYNYILIQAYNKYLNIQFMDRIYELTFYDKLRGRSYTDKIIETVYKMRDNIVEFELADDKLTMERCKLQAAVELAIEKIGDDLYI